VFDAEIGDITRRRAPSTLPAVSDTRRPTARRGRSQRGRPGRYPLGCTDALLPSGSSKAISPCGGHAEWVEPSPADRRVVPEGSAWSPLRIAAFRALWLAQLGSMIGTWMQTVGAQWLLVDEPNASTLVSLVQTAGLLPMLILALPAGVLADTFDRRRLLIGTQLATFTLGAILAGLALTSDLSPALLLTFTFLLGAGAAVSMPPWQALIPDIVPRHQVRAAAALGAVSMNLARAIAQEVRHVAFEIVADGLGHRCAALPRTDRNR